MTTLNVEVSDEIAERLSGKDIVKIDDILDCEEDIWETIHVGEEA
jgi:hypothetical protein